MTCAGQYTSFGGGQMNAARKRTRKLLVEIGKIDEYREIMDRVKLTPIEREVCDRKYLHGENLAFIGDMIGFSEDWTKHIHQRALEKIQNTL